MVQPVELSPGNERWRIEAGGVYTRLMDNRPVPVEWIEDRGRYVELSTGECIPWTNIRSFRLS